MPNYFYTDANGHKQGPINDQLLRVLVAQKKILPTTPLETEGGHKGLAGQIPGLFSAVPQQPPAPPQPPQVGPIPGIATPPPPKQLYCTNCGNPVSEKAVGCMSCGVKPTGHKKFCRQCGVGLNPEQVVCVRCGTSITAGYSGDAKQVIQSVMSLSSTEKFKKLLKQMLIGGIAVAVVVGFVYLAMIFWPSPHPLKRAKPGDWARYDVTISAHGGTMKGTALIEALSNNGKKVRLRTTNTNTAYGHWTQAVREKAGTEEEEVDLSKSASELALSMLRQIIPPDALQNVKVKKGKKTKDTVSVAGKTFNCVVIPETFTATITIPDGETFDITVVGKTWTSKAVPLAGTVKQEMDTTIVTKMETVKYSTATTIATFGNDPAIPKRAKERQIAEEKQRAREEEIRVAEERRRTQEEEKQMADERRREEEKQRTEEELRQAEERRRITRLAILDGATDFLPEIHKNGLDGEYDFMQYGSAELRDKLRDAERDHQNADAFGKAAAKARVDAVQAEVNTMRAVISQKTFLSDYAYRADGVKVDGNTSSFTMNLSMGFSSQEGDVAVSFPMQGVTGTFSSRYGGTISVRGPTHAIQDLVRNSNLYQARVRFKIQYVKSSPTASILKIDIVKKDQ